ncbi:hypothetical protein HK100_010553 [Physocladia obscura]|uniref:N-acetyltransferase domain-containing protein n=1 Tax=Physocladia obscura TaxID=109957 RepID=A0AAD5T4Z6_9FUNG|nr:hypothetical protein HK100_010553 [Physocladia obscura]
MSVVIRHLPSKPSQNDIDLIIQLRKECGWGLDLVPEWLDLTARGLRINFFIETSNDSADSSDKPPVQAAGMISLVLEDTADPDMASVANKTASVASLYVRPQFEGRGLGKAAMVFVEQFARDKLEVEKLTLGVGASNEKVYGMYYRIGYREFKERVEVHWSKEGMALMMKSI